MTYGLSACSTKTESRVSRGASVAAVALGLLAPAAAADQAATTISAPPATPASAQLPAPPANGEMGFVFSTFVMGVVPGMKDACPDGQSNMVKDNFLSTVSAIERDRLTKPENEVELTKLWKAYGFSPDHRMNACTNYDKFDHPLYKMVQSKIAYGVNLDNGNPNDPYVCPHQKFTGLAGDVGVDNQTYRALGCERNVRGPDGKIGDSVRYAKDSLVNEYTIVMILRNVHSLVNDDNVEVILASSLDKPIVDTQQNFIHDASYQVTSDPHYRAVLHGHIHDGVLTTDAQDVLFMRPIGLGGRKGLHSEWDFSRAKLKLAFKPDGSLDGTLGGYTPLTTFIIQMIYGGAGTVTVGDIDCSSAYRTLKTLADGERDPATGQCNRISAAMDVEAVPAFVFDHGPTKTADAK